MTEKKHHEKDIQSQCESLSEMTIGTLQAVTEQQPGEVSFPLIALLNSAAEILDSAANVACEAGYTEDKEE